MATVMKGDITGSAFTGTPATPGMQEHGFADKAKEKAGHFGSVAKDKAVGQLDSAKSQLCSMLGDVASGLDRAGRELDGIPRKAFEMSSQYVRRACDRINAGSAEDLLRDVGGQLRARPGVCLAGLVGIGFLAGRVMKS